MTGLGAVRRNAGTPALPGSAVRTLLLGLAVAALLVGCGYRPLGANGGPTGGHQVYVEAFTNETMRPGLQGVVAAELLRQLRFRGMLRSSESGPPDLILSGNVNGYQNTPVAFGAQDIGRRFRVRVTLATTLMGRADGKVRFSEAVWGEAYYTAGVGAVSATASEDEAVKLAAQDLASKLVARLMEEW